MLAQDRLEKVFQMVEKEGSVTVSRVATLLGASEATIRRDIILLAEQGKVNKVFGGATRIREEYATEEKDIISKLKIQKEEKSEIARYASSLICDDDFVFIDAGSTTLQMIDFLVGSKATFVTNGLMQASKLMEYDLKAYIIGGHLKRTTDAVIGSIASENISQYYFTKAFMGANGVSVEHGFSTPDPEEGATKAKVMRHSKERFFLVDSSKFDKMYASKIAKLEHATIITDKIQNQEYFKHTIIKETTI